LKVITLLNEKGGVGKTTLAVHIAAGLAAHNHRVLLVDADPQGSATRSLGLDWFGGLYRYIVQDASPKEVTAFLDPDAYLADGMQSDGYLAVMPGNEETGNITNTAKGQELDVFDRKMMALEPAFDYIVVDTNPTPSALHAIIALGSDYVVVPTMLETLSLDSFGKTISHLAKFQENRTRLLSKELRILGIVPTMAILNTIEHSENLKLLTEEYGNKVWDPIGRRIAWSEATTFRVPVWMLNSSDRATDEAWGLVERVEDEVNAIEA
jgi:chromosome partitioning protein